MWVCACIWAQCGSHACKFVCLVVISRWFCVCVGVCRGVGRVVVCINAWPRTRVSVQPCVTSNICSPAALPSCGTRQDFSLTWSGGTTWCSVPGARGLSPGPREALRICLHPHCQCLCGCVGMEADYATHTDTCNHIYFAWHVCTRCRDMIICWHINDLVSLYQTFGVQQLIKYVFSAGTYTLHRCTNTKNPQAQMQT